MKKSSLIILALVTGSPAVGNSPATEEKLPVKTKESTVTWKGYKVTGSHWGTVTLKEGALLFDEGTLSGGEFVVDMSSLVAKDLQGDSRQKLEGHLKSDDFFGVETYPTATLVFTEVKASGKNSYEVTGDLTIKGITEPVTFDVSIYGNKATANVKLDRSKYTVRYGSGSFFDNLGDKTIYDEFDLVVDLEF